MGLSINTQTGALGALARIQRSSAAEAAALNRLSTGRRINRAGDDPSGLVLFQQLSSQLGAINQASDNTQAASNIVSTADAALGQVGDRLVELRSNVVAALNSGVNSPESQAAIQNSIDQGLRAIDRIGQTTRFGDQPLLNGNLAFRVTGASSQLTNIDVQGGSFPTGFPAPVSVSVTSAATRAQAAGTISAAPQAGASQIRITGNAGSADVAIAAGATQQDVIDAVNSVREQTGVEAVAGGAIRSTAFGSAATVNVQELSGDLQGITPGFATGTDVVGTINGVTGAGRGNTLEINASALAAAVTVQSGTTGSFQFTIDGGGAQFQLGPVAGGANDLTLGINAVSSFTLGEGSGVGTLSTLATGGANSAANNPAGALSILDSASREISSLRSRLGSVQSGVFETNLSALGTAFQNLSASRSDIGDANFAEEVSAAVRNRLARQAGIFALGQSNISAGAALRLLG